MKSVNDILRSTKKPRFDLEKRLSHTNTVLGMDAHYCVAGNLLEYIPPHGRNRIYGSKIYFWKNNGTGSIVSPEPKEGEILLVLGEGRIFHRDRDTFLVTKMLWQDRTILVSISYPHCSMLDFFSIKAYSTINK